MTGGRCRSEDGTHITASVLIIHFHSVENRVAGATSRLRVQPTFVRRRKRFTESVILTWQVHPVLFEAQLG